MAKKKEEAYGVLLPESEHLTLGFGDADAARESIEDALAENDTVGILVSYNPDGYSNFTVVATGRKLSGVTWS